MTRAPHWFVAVLAVALLLGLALSAEAKRILDAYAADMQFMMWIYPIYLVLSTVCSYLCYRERRELAWTLVVLSLLMSVMLFISQNAAQ